MGATRWLFGAGAGMLVLLAGFSGPGAVEKGKDVFARRCTGCHALDMHKEGPSLRGVFGRKAGGVAEFGYSEALKQLDARWDETTLDSWLADPESVAPNNDMAFRLKSAPERSAVIAYLKSLGTK